MTLKTLAVAFMAVGKPEHLAREAAILARERDAHLLGVSVTSDPRYYSALGAYMSAEVIDHIDQQQVRKAQALHGAFDAAVAAEGVRGEWRMLRSGVKTVTERILESGRSADMLLVTRPEDRVHQIEDIHEQVIRMLGRPVLMLPPGGTLGKLHRNALIGWSPTREASRAAFDALMLLEPGASVTLLHVGPPGDNDLVDGPMNDLAAGLARHGMSVTVTHRTPGEGGAGALIQREAFETGAAFIATGAFGHSRAYDFVVGAVTRQLLAQSTLPVLFSK